jgi:UDP-glucose 4-epimerase
MNDILALVTGATGFIGSHLVTELRRLDWSVVCVTRRPVASTDPAITCVYGDLSSPESLEYTREKVGPVDVVFHLAARMPTSCSAKETYDFLKANVLGTAMLLDSFLRLEASAFVYASSLPVIGKPLQLPITEKHPIKPTHPYLVSKIAAELVCEQIRLSEGRRVVSLRITSPFGPGMPETTVLPRFVRLALASKDIPLFGSGARTQNFVHVSDVVRACILAAQGQAAGVFNVGGAYAISMRDLADLIVGVVPRCSSQVVSLNVPDPQEDHRWDVDLSASRRALGYEPQVLLEDGLEDYIAFLQSEHSLMRWWAEA